MNWLIWLVLMIAMLAIEAATVNLVTIWFAAGSLAAMISSLIGYGLGVQLVAFFLVSILFVLGFFLIFKPRMNSKVKGPIATNADRIIGKEAEVIVDIENLRGLGQIKVGGQIWSAKSKDGQNIHKGETVYVHGISGVKAVVKKR